MSGFVLHIGTHKTGTTALQRTLGAARLPSGPMASSIPAST